MPPGQASADSISPTKAIIACFEDSVESDTDIEMGLVLIGLEGKEYQAYLQFVDGQFNFYRQTDDGWVGSENCASLDWIDPGIPEVSNCEVDLP